MASAYFPGQQVRLSGTFTVSGVATDPTAVVLTVEDPAGTITTPTAIKDGTGLYHYDLTPVLPGWWAYQWKGTGAVVASTEFTFCVITSSVV